MSSPYASGYAQARDTSVQWWRHPHGLTAADPDNALPVFDMHNPAPARAALLAIPAKARALASELASVNTPRQLQRRPVVANNDSADRTLQRVLRR